MLRKNKLINDIKLRKKYIYIYIYIYIGNWLFNTQNNGVFIPKWGFGLAEKKKIEKGKRVVGFLKMKRAFMFLIL
jgi:hypothetical protein